MRQLSAYELNLLHHAKIDPQTLDAHDNTPIEYITGMAFFANRVFSVNNAVLIPRVETEQLVLMVGDYLCSLKNPVTVVDIGTGSGCIGLTLLLQYSSQITSMVLSEVSQEALEVAKVNAARLLSKSLYSKVSFDLGDLAKHVDYPEGSVLVANLPYIPITRPLPEEVVDHEPAVALYGGETGDELMDACLSHHLTRKMKPRAVFLELDYATPATLLNRPGFETTIINDEFSKQRFAQLLNKDLRRSK